MANQEVPAEELTNSDSSNDKPIHRTDSSLLSFLPITNTSEPDRQAFRAAFVHSATIIFVLVCGVCALLAYNVLEPFLRSILWSILAGAFLFPFKTHLTTVSRQSLRQLDQNSYLLFYGLVILLPLKTLDQTIESILPLCLRKWKEILLIILFLPTFEFLQTGRIYHWIITISYDLLTIFIYIIHLFDSAWITTLVIGYIIAVLFLYNYSLLSKTILNLIAIPVWFILLIYLSKFLPVTYRLIGVFLLILLTFVGFIVDLRENINQKPTEIDQQNRKSIFSDIANAFNCLTDYFHSKHTQSSLPLTLSSATSTPYFRFILWSLITIKVYQFYHYILIIIIFCFTYILIKHLLIKIYHYLIKQERVQYIIQEILQFIKERQDVFTPSPLHALGRFIIKGDKKFNHVLQASIDYLVSAFMIVTLLITVLFGSILLIIQIQHESIHMIKLTSNLINETNVLQQMLPDKEYMTKLMDTAVDNFYSAGKTYIIKQVHTLSNDNESNIKLEKDVLDLWENLYEYMTNTSNLLSSSEKNFSTPLNHTLLISNFDFNLKDLYNLIENNLSILRTVFDAIWTNTTLFLTLLTTIITFLFNGSFALFNFLVSFFVFVTLLFYLLSYSDQPIYQPTQWLNNTLSIGGKNLGQAVNEAVTSVFVASLKIAAFYGLYTYVLHTLVGSNLVFLPAVIASICAVTLKSYWAALPGCLDLWLVQQRPFAALILLLGQIAPVYVVDTAIYSEVKGGGHQYLTALAIAGGVYYRGIEGALIGPIVLCCLLVGMRLYNETMATLSSNNEQELSTKTLVYTHDFQPITTNENH